MFLFLQLLPILTTGTHGEKSYLEKLEEAFNILDKFLEGQNWVAGNAITIADYSIVASVSSIEVSH
jgi:glutathione S-transferase